MKLLSTKNKYSSSQGDLHYNDELTVFSAFSYGWWQFIATDKIGNVILNNSTYSNQTSKHQWDAKSILHRLGIAVNFELHHTLKSISDIGIYGVINDEINCIRSEIVKLIAKIKTKGSWKKTNIERRDSIQSMFYQLKDIRSIRNNYINKRVIPVKKEKCEYSDFELRRSTTFNTVKQYFLNDKRILDINTFRVFVTSMGFNAYKVAQLPVIMPKLVNLLGIKKGQLRECLQYEYIGDIEGMIPNQDTSEYILLLRSMKRLNINKESLNSLQLDKLHTYLINKLNRQNFIPSEPKQFKLSEKLLSIECKEGVRLIKTDRELRAEGKKQSHCIGGSEYIKRCLQGHQVLNFKGYTFLLSSTNQVLESSGKHNNHTPSNIQHELERLVA